MWDFVFFGGDVADEEYDVGYGAHGEYVDGEEDCSAGFGGHGAGGDLGPSSGGGAEVDYDLGIL